LGRLHVRRLPLRDAPRRARRAAAGRRAAHGRRPHAERAGPARRALRARQRAARRARGGARGRARRALLLGARARTGGTRLPSRRGPGARGVRAMKVGLERLLADRALRRPLAGRRVALLAHPASVTRELTHSLDALAALGDLRLTAALGPQHGLRGDKQDNMIESPDYVDPVHGIPVFSLYGTVRRPTQAMLDTFDVLLVDLQDLGCRIYTFITT